MAYSPRTDLLTPHTLPDTQGYGPGITAGMNSFTSLVSQGLTAQRQDKRDAKLWDQTLQRDQMGYDSKASMMDKRAGMADKKELISKTEELEFTDSLWDGIKTQMPGVISDEMNEKYVSASLSGKRALAIQGQAAFTNAMKSQLEADRRAAEAEAGRYDQRIPGTDYVGNGRGQALPLAKSQPPPGFQGDGNGVGAFYGPGGKPINPAYLLKQGPTGDMQPALPRPPARPPAPIMIEQKPYRMNPDTGAYEPIPIQSGTGNPNADVFNKIQ